eukprot:SAG31_NODE_3136_length_4636_cov_1.969583_1_plen_566_part_00
MKDGGQLGFVRIQEARAAQRIYQRREFVENWGANENEESFFSSMAASESAGIGNCAQGQYALSQQWKEAGSAVGALKMTDILQQNERRDLRRRERELRQTTLPNLKVGLETVEHRPGKWTGGKQLRDQQAAIRAQRRRKHSRPATREGLIVQAYNSSIPVAARLSVTNDSGSTDTSFATSSLFPDSSFGGESSLISDDYDSQRQATRTPSPGPHRIRRNTEPPNGAGPRRGGIVAESNFAPPVLSNGVALFRASARMPYGQAHLECSTIRDPAIVKDLFTTDLQRAARLDFSSDATSSIILSAAISGQTQDKAAEAVKFEALREAARADARRSLSADQTALQAKARVSIAEKKRRRAEKAAADAEQRRLQDEEQQRKVQQALEAHLGHRFSPAHDDSSNNDSLGEGSVGVTPISMDAAFGESWITSGDSPLPTLSGRCGSAGSAGSMLGQTVLRREQQQKRRSRPSSRERRRPSSRGSDGGSRPTSRERPSSRGSDGNDRRLGQRNANVNSSERRSAARKSRQGRRSRGQAPGSRDAFFGATGRQQFFKLFSTIQDSDTSEIEQP